MKYKVGDWVVVSEDAAKLWASRVGKRGLVVDIYPAQDYSYRVQWADTSQWYSFNEEEIELAPVFQGAPQIYPDNNPKTLVGAAKVPLHLVPPSAKFYLAQALKNGADKYGSYNWRDAAISVSTYKAAMERHMDAFWDGEDLAEDSGVHHVAHAMACAALILDALSIDKLVDDRPTAGASSRLQQEYVK